MRLFAVPVFAIVLAFAGCATESGHGFGEIAEVTLGLGFEPGEARDLGDGWFLTDLGYRAHLDHLEVGASCLALEQLPGAGGSLSFDPAAPPAGYTLCHNGHCHAEDGSLHSYEEVEAELAGGDGSWMPVVSFDLDHGVDLLAGDTEVWQTCEPDCTLPRAHVQRASLTIHSVALMATFHDDDAGTTGWNAVIEAEPSSSLVGTLDLPFDRDHDPVVLLDLAATVSGTLLDGVDPDVLLPGGGDLDLIDASDVVTRLGATPIEASVERRPFEPETELQP